MEKICHDWKHLLDKDFTNGKYWNDFAENAQNASVEIKIYDLTCKLCIDYPYF